MVAKRKSDGANDTVVVSFRAPRELAVRLEEIASNDQRTRANFIVRTLTQAVSLEPAIQVIEQIQMRLVEEYNKEPDGIQTEYWRGAMGGARSMLINFFSKRAMRWVNGQVKARTHLPMPAVIPIEKDGRRYGIDTESDLEL